MTIGEANAVNQMLEYLLRYHWGAARTDDEELEEAGALLAKGARKALSAGYTPQDWLTKWKRRPKP